MGPYNADRFVGVSEWTIDLMGTPRWGNNDSTSTCGDTRGAGVVGVRIGCRRTTTTKSPPPWANNTSVCERDRPQSVKDLLLCMREDLAGAIDREDFPAIDKQLARSYKPQDNVVRDGRIRTHCDSTAYQEGNLAAADAGNGHGQAIAELVHGQDGIMQLAGVLQARIDEELAAHIQVRAEREDQATAVAQDVVELRIEVRAEEDFIACPGVYS